MHDEELGQLLSNITAAAKVPPDFKARVTP